MKNVSRSIGLFVAIVILVGVGSYYIGKNQAVNPESQTATALDASSLLASLAGTNTVGDPANDIGSKWDCWFFFWGSWVDSGTRAGHWCVYIAKPMPTGVISSTVLSTSSSSPDAKAANTTAAKCLGYWCISNAVVPKSTSSAGKDPESLKLATKQCTEIGGKVISASNFETLCAVQENTMITYIKNKFGSYSDAYQKTPLGVANSKTLDAAIKNAQDKGLLGTK